MDWKYLVTTAIALFAVIVAWLARKDAKKSVDTANSLQQRLEVYEYLPILKLAIEPDGNRIKISITNASAKNAALDCKLTTSIRIWAGDGVYHVEKEQIQNNYDLIPPQTTITLYPDEVNNITKNSISFLNQYKTDKDKFIVRCKIECSAAHPRSPKSYKDVAASFSYEDGCLEYTKNQPSSI
ncbi:hypothetical protein [Aeromonas hydrophila]|uniref:hypothetical protein n=2 Tax=Aeromonas TaxID=642 RepID=UPI002440FD1E|nr:hypothetical protein [Aeromonas hydrophila]